jgi:hypothetical protein
MMRNKQPNRPSKAGIPVPAASADDLPLLTEEAQLDADLGALERAIAGRWICDTHLVSCLKAALPFIDEWREDWRAWDRPANTDEIAREVLRLTTTMPSRAGNIDQRMLTGTLRADIAELRPTSWALRRGCRAHRGKSEFLSFAKLEKEIRRAERRAEDYRGLLELDLVEELKSAEDRVQSKVD